MEIQQVMEELKRQLSASQQKVDELTKENGKLTAELQQQNGKLIAELQQQKQDFDQQKQNYEGRIAQLQQEKEEILKQFGKKLAEEEVMVSMHEMKIQLPLENWYDLLVLVPRRQLGMLASQIGDRQFARILQLFLHDERREITLGRMEIIPPRPNVPSDRPMVQGCDDEYAATDLPDWPMPGNVTHFDRIDLNYVDVHVIDFLRKFQENYLLTNVNLDFGVGAIDRTLPAVKKIFPLISSIYSIYFPHLFHWIYDSDKETQLLLKTFVAQTRILSISWYTSYNRKLTDAIDWCCYWLYTQRDAGTGMPRALVLQGIKPPDCSFLIDRITKDFEEANHAVSFFIRFTVPKNYQQAISLKNDKTNEKLVIKSEAGLRQYEQSLLISRHPSKAAKHKLEEDEKEIFEWKGYRGYRERGDKRICFSM